MKRLSFIDLVLITIFSISILTIVMLNTSCSNNDERIIFDDFELEMIDDYTYSIIHYNGIKEKITIPTLYEGKKITTLKTKSFNNSVIREITIPDGIEVLESQCFINNTNLEKIILETNNIEIGNDAILNSPNAIFYIINTLYTDELSKMIPQEKLYVISKVLVEGENEQTYKCGDVFILPEAINKDGYNFLSWKEKNTNKIYYPNDEYVVTIKDACFVPVYEEKQTLVTLTFIKDNETFEEIKEISINTEITLPVITKEGYVFISWIANGKEYLANEKYTVLDKDVTFIAKWEKEIIYTVTFIVDDAIVKKVSVKPLEEIDLFSPLKDNFDFLYWTDELNNEYYTSDSIIANNDLTLKAVFKEKEKKTTINLNVNMGDTLDNDTLIIPYQEITKLPFPTREGFTFMGWSEETYDVYIDKYTCKKNTYQTDLYEVTLYAMWIPNEYAHFCIEDTFENNDWHKIYYINTVEELLSLPLTGYAFLNIDVNNRNHEWIPFGDRYLEKATPENGLTEDRIVDKPYMGYFDGQNHTIKNIKINNSQTNYLGLFGYLEGYVYNLNISNIEITSIDTHSDNELYIGSLFGYQQKGKIVNCKGNNITINATKGKVGLLGGFSNGGFAQIEVSGSITVNQTSEAIIGGLIGCKGYVSLTTLKYAQVDNITVDLSLNVTSKENNNIVVGGLFGKVDGEIKISNCDIKGNAIIENINRENIGKLCGITDKAILTNCNTDSFIIDDYVR